MQTITLDLIPQEVKPVLKVSQYDDNWDVKIFITENGEALGITPADIGTLIIRKPDGNIVTLEAAAAYADAFKVSLTEQACACYGDSFGELIIETNSGGVTRRKGTCNFILSVEISPEFGGIASDSAISNLRTQIAGLVESEVNEIAPDIIAELAPSIIGSEYLTKTQIEAAYYNKNGVNNLIAGVTNKAIIQTLTAGNTTISFTTSLSANALVEFKINEPDVIEPTISETTENNNRIFTLTFEEAFDHDVTIMLLNIPYEVIT